MEVGIRELKNRATELMRRVERGEEIIVTRHSRPIARLTAYHAEATTNEDKARARMAELGLLRRGRKAEAPKAWRPVKIEGKPLSELIIEEREDRF